MVPPKKAQPKPVRTVREREFVDAVADWLRGDGWACADAAFRPYHGTNVRLAERGDQLTEDGVPILSRDPMALHGFREGTINSNRIEAFALCARAVRLLGGDVPPLLQAD